MKANEWMGRYRPLVRELVRYENRYARFVKTKLEIREGYNLTAPEWQMLEYLIEQDDDNCNMVSVSETLGIAPSTLSKLSKSLQSLNLISCERIDGNKKNRVLRPTEEGYILYDKVVEESMKPLFNNMFRNLEGVPDEYIQKFSSALYDYTRSRETGADDSEE